MTHLVLCPSASDSRLLAPRCGCRSGQVKGRTIWSGNVVFGAAYTCTCRLANQNIRTDKRVSQPYGNYVIKREHTPLKKLYSHLDEESPGTRIRKARLDKNLYLYELAELAGLTPEEISHIERGFIKIPKPKTVKKLAKVLSKPIWYLGCYDKLPEKTIGQKLKKARLYHAHTLSDAAKYLGVNERSIRNWEKDARKPLPDNLKKLEKYFGVLK